MAEMNLNGISVSAGHRPTSTEEDINSEAGHVVRRRRKIGMRPKREKTPDPNFVATNASRSRKYSEDDSSTVEGPMMMTATMTTSEEALAQSVRMQIRPPHTVMSAHESKILRRRDKTIASAAARSLSQPRQAERLTAPAVYDLLRTVKRSLSSPRHKDESSEGGGGGGGPKESAPKDHQSSHQQRQPPPPQRSYRRTTSDGVVTAGPISATDEEKLNRLELNMRRFEDERKRFETEKRHFEREKRDHKLRYKQMFDNEERKRLLQSYRKLSDRIQLPTDPEERRRMIHSLRLQRNEEPTPKVAASNTHPTSRPPSGVYDESSTQFSSSEADTEVDERRRRQLERQLSPQRRHVAASVRGPPPQPPQESTSDQHPPRAPERRAVSRNNSLSPLRPERRSRTPDQRAEMRRKLDTIVMAPVPPPTSPPEEPPSMEVRLRRNASLERPRPQSRKQSLVDTPPVAKVEPVITSPTPIEEHKKPLSFLQKLKRIFRRGKAIDTTIQRAQRQSPSPEETPLETRSFVRQAWRDLRTQWVIMRSQYPAECNEIRRIRNKCFAHTIMLILLLGFGGLMFRYTEGAAENIYKCEVRKVKRDFIDNLWTFSHNMREDDWKSLARQKLKKFEEELHTLQELGQWRPPNMKSWNFVNCILFCWTVLSTIGYGHIAPATTLGRSLAIVYAIIGIPLFLILLADFGKLFTRGMKFLWVYVRRLYYTGTCRRIRKQQQVLQAISGLNTAYDMAIRRPSEFFSISGEGEGEDEIESQGRKSMATSNAETPTSPYLEAFEIDDQFNLPISVASALLISYILIGASVYTLWEDWTYFEAFYFVFISMSTIGFGDFVPKHPIFMMCSIIYLVFGLALTSMFINVVQIKLNDTFNQASAKIGATIGIGAESDADADQARTSTELASVHGSDGKAPPPVPPSILRGTQQQQSSNARDSTTPPPLPQRQVTVVDPPVERTSDAGNKE